MTSANNYRQKDEETEERKQKPANPPASFKNKICDVSIMHNFSK